MLPTAFRFIWLSSFRGEDFKNRPISNNNGLWRPCLLMDRDKMSTIYRGPSIDASYQVSAHLPEGFQRRRLKCDGRQTTDAKWWQKLTLPLARWAKINCVSSIYWEKGGGVTLVLPPSTFQSGEGDCPSSFANKVVLVKFESNCRLKWSFWVHVGPEF